MKVPDQVKCDMCLREKGETNHWLVAVTRPGFAGIIFQPADTIEAPPRPDFTYEDICSHACATKRFSQWLGTLTPTQKGL